MSKLATNKMKLHGNFWHEADFRGGLSIVSKGGDLVGSYDDSMQVGMDARV